MQTGFSSAYNLLHKQVAHQSDGMTGSSLILSLSSVSSSNAKDSPLHCTLLASDDSPDNFKVMGAHQLPSNLLPTRGTSMAVEYEQQDLLARGQKWEIAEQAKHEAKIENRIAELKKDGLWSLKRLSKVPEPVRPKIHWDYLCEEMQWLAADFAQERRWKRGVARKVVRMVLRHHEEQRQKGERAKREEQAKLKRMAASIAKEVRQFWSNVEKVVQFKQQSRLEEKRKKALDLQLDFIVGQTEKYSDLLSQSLNENMSKRGSSYIGSSRADSATSSPPASITEDEDVDFEPHEEDDDEETIEVEEQQEGNDAETHRQEIEMLKRDSELPIEQLLESLPPEILEDSGSGLCETEDDDDEDLESDANEEMPKAPTTRTKGPLSWAEEEEDDEFTADEDEGEDVEETIQEEEELEGEVDHTVEIDELAREGILSMEELLDRYAGAYQEDFKFGGNSDSFTSEDEEEEETSGSEEKEDGESSESLGEDQDEEDQSSETEIGMEYLLGDSKEEGELSNDSALTGGRKEEITDIAAAAESLQPKGYTLATTQVKTPIPFLLRGTLREYQHIGLDWLVTMYEKKLNGILADEMGLGKTIQTISLLAHLACEKGNWGPHLIIVPTSVMLNWEMEFKRWCPGFKILTYYGTQKERKLKRQGWTKPNAFHVCITSYKLVLQDHQAFRRKNWKYLILDEAQNIKNFKSQRWQSLLNFNSQRRLLLTGTPLQNSLMELWSLMHFLMPHVFQSHREFKEWFSNPLTGMIEGSQEYNENLIKRLHKVLRPFLLRRIKVDVEKQMPKKYEHIIRCRLSKRQRYLYDDFMSQTSTKETLTSGHFMSVINILMQLRKVCNHPNLFDPRPILSPFITEGICFKTASIVLQALEREAFKHVDLGIFDLVNLEYHVSRYEAEIFLPKRKVSRKLIEEISEAMDPPPRPKPVKMKVNRMFQPVQKPDGRTVVLVNSPRGSAAPGVTQQHAASTEPSDTVHTLQPSSSPHMVGPVQSVSPVQPATAVQVAPSVQSTASVHMATSVQSPAPVQSLTSIHLAAPVQSAVSVPSPAQLHLTAPVHIAASLQTGSSVHVAAPVQSAAPIQPGGVSLHAPVSHQVAMPTSAVVAGSVTAASPAISQPPSVYHQLSAVRPPTVMVHPALGQTTMPVLSSPVSALPVLQAQVPLSPAAVIANVPRPPALTSTVSSTMKPATIPATAMRMSAAALAPGNMGNMMKPVTVHSSAQLPGYAFPSMGTTQQRLILSPDMQARLPSGEVVSIAQLASLANRPVANSQGNKPLTFQLQGNKLTLTGTQIRQMSVGQPRQVQGNVVHLVSAGGQHHLISQPTQVALIQAMAQQQTGQASVGIQAVTGPHVVSPSTVPVPSPGITLPLAATQVTSSMMNSPGVVKIVVRQAPKDGIPPTAVQPPRPMPQPVAGIQSSVAPAQRMTLPNPFGMSTAQPPLPARPPVVSPAQIQNPVIPAAPVRPMIRAHQPPVATVEQQAAAVTPPPVLTSSQATSVASTSTLPSSTACSPAIKPEIMPSSTVVKEEPDTLMLRTVTTTPPPPLSVPPPRPRRQPPPPPRTPFYLESLEEKKRKQKEERLDRIFRINERHCTAVPMYGTEILRICKMFGFPSQKDDRMYENTFWNSCGYAHCCASQAYENLDFTASIWTRTEALTQVIHSPLDRIKELDGIIERFIFAMPPVEAPPITMHASHPPPSLMHSEAMFKKTLHRQLSKRTDCLHRIICNMRTQFPDRRLIQYDCGKLQTLDILLRHLKMGSHRVLIFTQMTRMLDVLEQFLNFHGHIYLRLDGTTRVDQRQALMDRFNADKRIFCFILSTRSGGVGVNLTGADTVVFYDSDWNPTMDAQAQDRCHRIGQTRDVHIYRLISERTVEENILKKANQKRMLGDVAIEGGNFTTAYFKQQTIRELFDMPLDEPGKKETVLEPPKNPPQHHNEKEADEEEEDEDNSASVKQTQILEQALCKAEDEEDIQAASLAKAEQVAELAEFNENIPLDMEDGTKEEEEELSKVELEIAALVEQLTPIERYAMNFLEASLEDVSKEQLKQAEEEVEAARKDLDQAKDEVLKLPDDEESRMSEEAQIKKRKSRSVRNMNERPGTRVSERLRGARPKEAEKVESNSEDRLNTCVFKESGQVQITGEVQFSNKPDVIQKEDVTSTSAHLKDAVHKAGSPTFLKGPEYCKEQGGVSLVITGAAEVHLTGKNRNLELQVQEETSAAQVMKSSTSLSAVCCSSKPCAVESSFHQGTESCQSDAPQSSSLACVGVQIPYASHELQAPLKEPLGQHCLPENLAEKAKLTNEVESDMVAQPLSYTFPEAITSQSREVTVSLTQERPSLEQKRVSLAEVRTVFQETRDMPKTKALYTEVESSNGNAKMVSGKTKTLFEHMTGFSSDCIKAIADQNVKASPISERQISPSENSGSLLRKGMKVTVLSTSGRTVSNEEEALPFDTGSTPVELHSNIDKLDKLVSEALKYSLAPAVNTCTGTSQNSKIVLEGMETTHSSVHDELLSRMPEALLDDMTKTTKYSPEAQQIDCVEHYLSIPNRKINTVPVLQAGGKQSKESHVDERKVCSVFSNEKLLKNVVVPYQNPELKHHVSEQVNMVVTVEQPINKDKPLMKEVISETVQSAFGGYVEIPACPCTGPSLPLQFPEALQKGQFACSVPENATQELCQGNASVLTENLCKENKALVPCDVHSEGHKTMETIQREIYLSDMQKKMYSENAKQLEVGLSNVETMAEENREINVEETGDLNLNKQLKSDSKDSMIKLFNKNEIDITGVLVSDSDKPSTPAEHQIVKMSLSKAFDQGTTVSRLHNEKRLSLYSPLASSQIHLEHGEESELNKDSSTRHILVAKTVEADESSALLQSIKTDINKLGSLDYNSTLNESNEAAKCSTTDTGEIMKSMPFESESKQHSFMLSSLNMSNEGNDQVAEHEECTAVLKSPRRRTTADGEIRQSQSDGDSPSAKVLRKLPGRIITVVEERKPARCKRKRMEKEDSADQLVKAELAHGSSNSYLGGETADGQNAVLRNLQIARRKIEFETVTAAGLSEIDFQAKVHSSEVDPKDCDPVSETLATEMPVLRNLASRRRVEVEAKMAALFTSQKSVPHSGIKLTEIGEKEHSPQWETAEHKTEKQSHIVSAVPSESFEQVKQGPEKTSDTASPEASQRMPTRPDAHDAATLEVSSVMAESGTIISTSQVSGNQAPVQKRKRGRPPKTNRSASNSLISRQDKVVDRTVTSKWPSRLDNESSEADMGTSSAFQQIMSKQTGSMKTCTGEGTLTEKIKCSDEAQVDRGCHVEEGTLAEKKTDGEMVFPVQKRKRGRPRKIQKDEKPALPGSVKQPSCGVVKKPERLEDTVVVQQGSANEISKQNTQTVTFPTVNYVPTRKESEVQPCIQKRKRGRPRLIRAPVEIIERSEPELGSESFSIKAISPKLQTEECLKNKMQLNQSIRLTRQKFASLNRSQDQTHESDSEMSSDDYSKLRTRAAKQRDGVLDINLKDKDSESEKSVRIPGCNLVESVPPTEPSSTFPLRVKHTKNPKEFVKSIKRTSSPKCEPVKCGDTLSMDSSTSEIQSTECKEVNKQKPFFLKPQPEDTIPDSKYDEAYSVVASTSEMSSRYDCTTEFKSTCAGLAIKSAAVISVDSSASESHSSDCKVTVKKTPPVSTRTKSTTPVEKYSDASSFDSSKSDKAKQTEENVFCSKPKKSEACALKAPSYIHQSVSQRRHQKLKAAAQRKTLSPEHKVECSTPTGASRTYADCTAARYPKRSEIDRRISLHNETRSTVVPAESELVGSHSSARFPKHKESIKRKTLSLKLPSKCVAQAVKSCDALSSEGRVSEPSSPEHKEMVHRNPLSLDLKAVTTLLKSETLSNCNASEIKHSPCNEKVRPKSFPSRLTAESIPAALRDASSLGSSAKNTKSPAHRELNKPQSSQNPKKNLITPFLKSVPFSTANSASQRGSPKCKDVIRQKTYFPKPKRKTLTPVVKCVDGAALDSPPCTKSVKHKAAGKQNFSPESQVETPVLVKSAGVEIVQQQACLARFQADSSLADKSELTLVESISEARFLKCKQAVKQTSSCKHEAKSKDLVIKPDSASIEKRTLQIGGIEVKDSLRQKVCSKLKSLNKFLSAAQETDDTSSVDSSISEVYSESHKEVHGEKKPISRCAVKTESQAVKSDDASSVDSSTSGRRSTPKSKSFYSKTKLRKLTPLLKSDASSVESTSEASSPKSQEAVSSRLERKGLPAPQRSDEASSADSASEAQSPKFCERVTPNRSTRWKPGSLVSPLKSEKQILKIQKEQSTVNEIINLRTKAVSSEQEDSDIESSSEEDDHRSMKRYRDDSDRESSKRQRIELTERFDIKKSACCPSAEGTPDRMLRSVAAAVAAAAATPANNTRSSASSATVLVSSVSSLARRGGGGSVLGSTTGNRGRKPKT